MPVEFGVLGSVEVAVDGQPVALKGLRQRAVLAVLLVEANRLVSRDQLLDRAWAPRRYPDRPANAVQTQITLLRRALAGIPEAGIAWQSSGYRLSVAETSIDLHRFRALVDAARAEGDGPGAVALFERALALWRGEPFTEPDLPWFDTMHAIMTREHHAAGLDLTDARLRLGQHAMLLPELDHQAKAHPLDERIAGQYLLALYRSGRAAEALRHYQRVRGQLGESLGTDPGLPLQELHQQILTASPAIAGPSAPGSTQLFASTPVPRQLPAAPRAFTGRLDELAVLTKLLDAPAHPGVAVVIAAVAGPGGIGKTWLALQWAHQNRERFPDGQLFVDLRGFSPDGRPSPPTAVLRGFLGALGVESARIPAEETAQSALWRTLTASRRMLVVLDNAADTAQVLPLLPGSPSCTVLVTSRDHLSGLVSGHGAHPLPLDILTDGEARALLLARLGEARMAEEPEAVADLVAFCSGFPLALSIVSGQAQLHPHLPLATLAAELAEAGLGALEDEDPSASLPAVLSWSYRALSEEQAQAFALLALATGPDIGLGAASALLGLGASSTRLMLRALERASLLQQDVPGRWRMHDLIRRYVTLRARQRRTTLPEETALRRMIDFYLHTASAADQLLIPAREPLDLPEPMPGCLPHRPADLAAALNWFDTEHHCLSAMQRLAEERGWHRQVWQLASALATYHWRRGRARDNMVFGLAAVAAADELAEPAIANSARRLLGTAYAQADRDADALTCLHEALAIARDNGSRADLAETHRVLSWVSHKLDEDERGLDHALRALELFRELGDPIWVADLLKAAGWHSAKLGRYVSAREYCLQALALHQANGHRYPDGEGTALGTLAFVAQQVGEWELSLDYFRRALLVFRELGDGYLEADALFGVGDTYLALGQRGQTRAAWQQALAYYRAHHRAEQAQRVSAKLAELVMQT